MREKIPMFQLPLSEPQFELDVDFLNEFATERPDWGPVGEYVYRRTYARTQHDTGGAWRGVPVGETEVWWQTCARVVEGVYQIQQLHCRYNQTPWDARKAQLSAQEMYERMFDFRFLPPGRGLWMMGTDHVRHFGACALQNCSFLSTGPSSSPSFSRTAGILMDLSMLGVGVGFDTLGAGSHSVHAPFVGNDVHVVEDSREGWISAMVRVIDAYLAEGTLPAAWDYSQVRPEGAPIKGFGGVAAGPGPLQHLLEVHLPQALDPLVGGTLTSSAIVDVMCMIGRCVVSGNVRRSALIAIGQPDDEAYLDLKNPDVAGDALMGADSWRWSSNNSVEATVGMDYAAIGAKAAINGEPGLVWLDNLRSYGRMADGPDERDYRVMGVNPCQPGWATVLTPAGIRTFDDISVGSTIWTGSKWTKVVRKLATGVKDVYAYRTRAGEFIGTENHQVFQYGERCEVRQAEAIDRAVGPRDVAPYEINPTDVIDGLVFGDGMYHKASNRVLLCVGENDDYSNTEVDQFIGDCYGGSTYQRVVRSRFSHLPRTYDRVIPDEVMRGTPQQVAGFLRGLYSANGSIVARRVTLKTASHSVRGQVMQLLSSLGIRSYFTVNPPKNVMFENGEYECRESYDVNITTDRCVFRSLIGFLQAYKNSSLDGICDVPKNKFDGGRTKETYEIKEVEHLGRFEVYDITVEDEEHCYWTGGLKVSNCGEMSLEHAELCCLVETFPARHDSYEDYERTLKYAYLYAKTVTLVPTHIPEINTVMRRNRRIGVSQTGITQNFARIGRREHFRWCDRGYRYLRKLDEVYSDWLAVPRSIKLTTTKPSGSVSKLAGATSGIHWPLAQYYIQRMRLAANSPLVRELAAAGYEIEPDVTNPSTSVVAFPVEETDYSMSSMEVPISVQVQDVVSMQRYWADNAVSVTVMFDQEREAHLVPLVLEQHEADLKSISFLPYRRDAQVWAQAPWEAISKDRYEEMVAKLRRVDSAVDAHERAAEDRFCEGDRCAI